jgi:hypothetical protein
MSTSQPASTDSPIPARDPQEAPAPVRAAYTGAERRQHQRATGMADAAEMLWVVLANVSGGDWTQQSAEWQLAVERWRDNYFAALRQEEKGSRCDVGSDVPGGGAA